MARTKASKKAARVKGKKAAEEEEKQEPEVEEKEEEKVAEENGDKKVAAKKKEDNKEEDDDKEEEEPKKKKAKNGGHDDKGDDGEEEEEEEEPEEKEKPKKKKAPSNSKSKKKEKKEKKKDKKEKKKKKEPEPEPEEVKPSKIGEYELRFGSLEVVLAAGDFDASTPQEKFLLGRLQEDILFGCDSEAYVSVEWYDLVEGNKFEAQGIENIDYLPAGSLVCSVTKWCKEGFAKGKETLTVANEAWEYGEKKLQEQLDDNYQSDEDSQFGDEAVTKRLKFIGKAGTGGRRKSTKAKADSDDDGGDDDSDDGGDSKKRTPRKRKAPSKKAASSPKSPKRAKKGLNPRPDFPVVEDSFDQKTGTIDSFDGDVERANKEIFRAVQADDVKALQAAIKSENAILTMHYPRSIGLPITPLMYAMVEGNVEATKILLDDAKERKTDKRARMQPCALPELSTGRISGKHANYNRRRINASRGGKEGNNALLHDTEYDHYAMPGIDHNGRLVIPHDTIPIMLHKYKEEMIDLNLARDFDEVPKEILDLAEATYDRNLRNDWVIENIMRGGHRNMAKRHIEQQLNIPYFANNFNFLHLESLGDTPTDKKKPFSKDFLAKSVAKMSQTETRFSPLACACINPKTAYIEALLSVAPEHAQLCDSKGTSLVHYAAACEGPEPLMYLIEKHSLSKLAIDKRKEAPIHYAARAARPRNITVLLEGADGEQKKSMLAAKTSEGFAPIHYAVITQRCDGLETIRTLLDAGSDPNLQSPAGRNKVSPVHLAARTGNLEALKLLVKHGGKPDKVDKIGRSPLIHACINGHAHIVSYLLVQGVSVEVPDSSDNFPVHYAAAYGWDDCLQLLLDAGANPDAKNSWMTSPLSVAVQKGRHRVSSLLLKIPSVDVNFKDDEGKTLFFRLMEGFIAQKLTGEGDRTEFPAGEKEKRAKLESDEEGIAAIKNEMPWALQKLLDRRDVDVSTTDPAGNTILHLVFAQNYSRGGYGEKRAVALTKLLMTYGKFDLNDKDSSGLAPVLCAVTESNKLLFQFLIERGASVGSNLVDKKGKNLCHFLLLSDEFRDQLPSVEAKAGESDFRAMLKTPNAMGFTPVHEVVKVLVGMTKSDAAELLLKTIKSLVDRFPELATQPVGPIARLKDPDRLARLIVGKKKKVEGDGNANNGIFDSDDDSDDNYHNRRHYGRHNHSQSSSSTILNQNDRAVPRKVRQALESREQAVPSTNDDAGKSLIHFICECKAPKRLRELLEWIVPLSKDIIESKGGTDNNVYTPLEQLLYKILPATDLRTWDETGYNFNRRAEFLDLILESIKLLQRNGAGDVNKVRAAAFPSVKKMEDYKDGGKKELTQEKDTERVKALKRLAEAIVDKTEKADSAKKEIVSEFEEIMEDRRLRILAKSLTERDFPIALTHYLAHASISFPNAVWEKLANDCGLDLMTCDKFGKSLLHVALNKRNEEFSRFMLKECPDLLTKATNAGEMSIHVVAKLDDARYVKMILDLLKGKPEEINRGDKKGRTAMHFSVEKASKRSGEPLDPCEILLLRAGARLDIPDSVNKRTPLHYCFLENASTNNHYNFPHSLGGGSHDRVELVSSLLAAPGASESVKMVDTMGRTPLCYAAAYSSTACSLLLVSKGSDLFQQDQDGNTPINIAVLRGHENYAMTMLKSVGNDSLPKLVDVVDVRRVEATSDSGDKVIKVTRKNVHSIVWHAIKQDLRGLVYILLDTSFPLQQAAIDALSHGSFQLVRKLFNTSPIDVIQHVDPETGRTLLHELSRVQHFSDSEWSTTLAEILLSSEIPPAAVNKDGDTALHIATSNGHIALVKLLLEADKSALAIQNKDGQTPLHIAVLRGRDPLVELLMKGDKSVLVVKNKDGRTPLHISASQGNLGFSRRFVAADSSPVLMEDNEGLVPLRHFMRALYTLDDNECAQMISVLTVGIDSLADDKYNRLPRRKRDEVTYEYKGIQFKLGPNKETIMEEIKASSSTKHDDKKAKELEAFSGHSSLVISALRARRHKAMQTLMDKGAPIDCFDNKGLSALHHAVISTNLTGMRLLLRNGAQPDVESKDENSVTPLILAVYQYVTNGSSLEMMNCLIANGADVTTTDKTTGVTALHVVCRENSADCAHRLLRAALHAAAKEKKGKMDKARIPDKDEIVLVKLGQDCMLYPAKAHEREKECLDVVHHGSVQLSSVSGMFDCGDLHLDSQKALVGLKLGSNGKTAAKTESATEREARQAREREARSVLSKYYGFESALVGDKDTMLTKPLKAGAVVLVQNTGPKSYANLHNVWMEGKVTAVHKNGTYDVDVYRDLPIKGAVRQQLRPWKSPKDLKWPAKAEKSNKPLKKLLETKDRDGHTPLMAAIKPVDFGAYEKHDIIDLLVAHGAIIDSNSLALARPGSDFRKHLIEVSGGNEETGDVDHDAEMKDASPLYGLEPLSSKEFEEETKNALFKLEARGIMKKKKGPPPINPVCELKGVGLRVLFEETPTGEIPSHYFDCTLTKVELSQYGHSENKYYKMQIVEDPNKKLYVLLNNWGQVGDYGGQKQETPFSKREEATTEFAKVFKQKTGNLWTDQVSSNFHPSINKYKPVRIVPKSYENPKLPNLAELINDEEEHPEIVRESKLPADLTETMKAFTDPTAISNATNTLGLLQEKLPLGRLSIKTLMEAESKLAEVEKALELASTKTKPAELTEKRDALETVAILSSQFYELLPTKEGDNALRPLTMRNVKEQRGHILSLKNLTVASQIVNSAFVEGTKVNPLDFAYRCLGGSLEVLSKDKPERVAIEQYFRNTSSSSDLVISQVYRLKRQEEASNEKMDNHRLLWHGTNRANVMGIIKEGLRVAPPTAMQSGNAFGDGVYFADMVQKSWGYCRENFNTNAAEMPKGYLFVADVALGKQRCFRDTHWHSQPVEDGTDSVWAVGYEGPDVKRDLVLASTGTVVPLGNVTNPTVETKAQWSGVGEKTMEAIEAVRSSPDTTYPVRIKTEYEVDGEPKPAEVVLEHGPLSETAKMVPINVRKAKDEKSPSDNNKKRKDNHGNAIKEEASGNADNGNQEYETAFKEFEIRRTESGAQSHVHYNEFIVNDTKRINLRFLVEVTSRGWLVNKAKREKEAAEKNKAKN